MLAAFHGKALECMPYGVPQVEGAAQALFVRIGSHDVALDDYRLAQQFKQLVVVAVDDVVVEQCGEVLPVAEQSVFEHLGISRQFLGCWQCVEKYCGYYHGIGLVEYAYLVFQPIEVDASLSAYRSIDSTKQCCRHIDEAQTSLEYRCGKSAQVGNYAPADVYYHSAACSPDGFKLFPHGNGGFDVFVGVARLDGDAWRLRYYRHVGNFGKGELLGVDIGQNHHFVVVKCFQRCADSFFYVV